VVSAVAEEPVVVRGGVAVEDVGNGSNDTCTLNAGSPGGHWPLPPALPLELDLVEL
jgi:hypothetical protein